MGKWLPTCRGCEKQHLICLVERVYKPRSWILSDIYKTTGLGDHEIDDRGHPPRLLDRSNCSEHSISVRIKSGFSCESSNVTPFLSIAWTHHVKVWYQITAVCPQSLLRLNRHDAQVEPAKYLRVFTFSSLSIFFSIWNDQIARMFATAKQNCINRVICGDSGYWWRELVNCIYTNHSLWDETSFTCTWFMLICIFLRLVWLGHN